MIENSIGPKESNSLAKSQSQAQAQTQAQTQHQKLTDCTNPQMQHQQQAPDIALPNEDDYTKQKLTEPSEQQQQQNQQLVDQNDASSSGRGSCSIISNRNSTNGATTTKHQSESINQQQQPRDQTLTNCNNSNDSNNTHRPQSSNSPNDQSEEHRTPTSNSSQSGGSINGDQMHTCKLCDKQLSSSSSLDRHMLTHSGERPFKCKRCSMTFTTNGNMHRHMRTHLHKDSLAQQKQSLAAGIIQAPSSNVMPSSNNSRLSSKSDHQIEAANIEHKKTQSKQRRKNRSITDSNVKDDLDQNDCYDDDATIISSDNDSNCNDTNTLIPTLRTPPIKKRKQNHPSHKGFQSNNDQEDGSGTSKLKNFARHFKSSHEVNLKNNNSSNMTYLSKSEKTILDNKNIVMRINDDNVATSSNVVRELSSDDDHDVDDDRSESNLTRSDEGGEHDNIESRSMALTNCDQPSINGDGHNIKKNFDEELLSVLSYKPLKYFLANDNYSQLNDLNDINTKEHLQMLMNDEATKLQFASMVAAAAQLSNSYVNGTNNVIDQAATKIRQQQLQFAEQMLKSLTENSMRNNANEFNCFQCKLSFPSHGALDQHFKTAHLGYLQSSSSQSNDTRLLNDPKRDNSQVKLSDPSGERVLWVRSDSQYSQRSANEGENDIVTKDEVNSLNSYKIKNETLDELISNSSRSMSKFEDDNNNEHLERTKDSQMNTRPQSTSNKNKQNQQDINNRNVAREMRKQQQPTPATSFPHNQPDASETGSIIDKPAKPLIEPVEEIGQNYVKTANPNATRKGGKRNRHCYKCKLCTYSSVDRCTLVRHLRIHSGERPYICMICRYAFTTKANCERHVRKRHKKQYNSLGGSGDGVKGSNTGGRSLIITDHSNHQTIPVKVNSALTQSGPQSHKTSQSNRGSSTSSKASNPLTRLSSGPIPQTNIPSSKNNYYPYKNQSKLITKGSSNLGSSKQARKSLYQNNDSVNFSKNEISSETTNLSGFKLGESGNMRADRNHLLASTKSHQTLQEQCLLLSTSPSSQLQLHLDHYGRTHHQQSHSLHFINNESHRLRLPFDTHCPLDLAAQALDLSCKFQTGR